MIPTAAMTRILIVGAFACCLVLRARGVPLDDAVTVEPADEALDLSAYTEAIRAHVNITFIDPQTGERRSEEFLEGKWGTNGIMEQVVAPAHLAMSAGNFRDGCRPLVEPIPTGPWIAIIERGNCRFTDKIRHALAANAAAVIVYDNEPQRTPLFMHHEVEDAVAIFVTKEFGDRIVRLIEDEGTRVSVRITVGIESLRDPQ